MRHSLMTFGVVALCVGFPGPVGAEVSPAEARLRDSVKGLMTQLRTLQTERDGLDAAKVEHEQKAKDLGEKLAALTKASAAERDTAERTIADLRAKVTDLEKENGGLKADLAQAVGVGAQTADKLKKRESEWVKLNERVIEGDRRFADAQRKNGELQRIAREILDRYEKFGLGTALTAREPFVGTTRVRLQNLVQDYSDKISEQRIPR